MAEYRIYCLDGNGGIGFAQWFDAGSDDEAIGHAQKLRPDAYRSELWERGRLVAALDHRSGTVNGKDWRREARLESNSR
jgi:hypothetical protein